MMQPRLACTLLALTLLSCTQPAQPADDETSPDAVAASFYRWYLTEAGQNRVAYLDRPEYTSRYVSSSFLQSISKRAHTADGLQQDPFLLAQDWPDNWTGNVFAEVQSMKGTNAEVLIRLGPAHDLHPQLLLVELYHQPQGWRVTSVRSSAP